MSAQLLASFIEREMKLGGAADVTLNRQQWQLVLPALRAQGWRPIAEAPKDRFILLYCPEDGSRWLAALQGGEWYGVDEQGLTRTGMGPDSVTGWKVTHWQEIPAPPTERAK